MNNKLKLLSFLISMLITTGTSAQQYTYSTMLTEHRTKYKNEFLEDARSPLKKEDTAFLRFYPPQTGFIVNAVFTKINDTKGFEMQTHTGVMKKYFVYGFVTFKLNNKNCKLFIYQSEQLMSKKGFEDHLFIPFTDETNYMETFGGGRYLDLKEGDIYRNKIVIDFNKCYNPYCAYKEGYACPIPPVENRLTLEIPVGEKLFGR